MQLNVNFLRKEEMLPKMIDSLRVTNRQPRRPSYTVEPRYNEGPGHWYNLFAVTRPIRYIEVIFPYILPLLG